ncbi:MAG: T9SS type A sorting domain-containing protein [bacterium]|nr:T9SS type A sorting domain-containing protein [bacterium]
MKNFLIMINVFAIASLLSGAQQNEVKLLRWEGPPGSKPGTFKEWNVSHPYKTFSTTLTKKLSTQNKAGKVAILIDSTIASSITNEVNQLMTNLQQEGYTVSSYNIAGGTPEDLRSFLKGLYDNDNIEGALFVGNLPVAWFQVGNDYGPPYNYGYAEWPIDLFYMDLNGDWVDSMKYGGIGDSLVSGKDSIYDVHSGNIDPEIYIGRLTPTGIGNDTLLIKNYFAKDNAYRHHSVELQHRALVYVEDDWYEYASEWAGDVSLLYDDTLVVSDSNATTVTDYRIKLDTLRAWVSVFAHSWPGGHVFYYNNHNSYNYYNATEYTNQDPPANFYNLFACSFARYTESGYGGGRTIFNQSYGVGAVGSTKTGSMLDFYYFYLPLSQGKAMGEAFKDWFSSITAGGVSFDDICWHYGMTLLGDPFLKPKGHNIGVEEKWSEATSRLGGDQISKLTAFPNPFVQSTVVSYTVDKNVGQGGIYPAVAVSLAIYDISGKLVEETKDNVIGKNLKTGIYFVKVNDSKPIKVVKMGIVK